MSEHRTSSQPAQELGVVVIGRNEGERLRRCLNSVINQAAAVVYVDSGSTDGSVALARSLGVDVVELDSSLPFTVARARNAGFEHCVRRNPALAFVQFVDGDSKVVTGWLPHAQHELETRPEVAVVSGLRYERFPTASIYNQLMDMDLRKTPVGEVKAFGGDAMMRVTAFQQVGGFNRNIFVGEEAELGVRLRERGWKIRQLDEPMSIHDAAMSRFRQWWQRSIRTGHGYAEGAWLHGRSPERHQVRESRSIWFWGALLPILTLSTLSLSRGKSLVLLLGYFVLALRIYRYARARSFSTDEAILYTVFCVLGKFPQLIGQIRFHKARLMRQRSALIEYKSLSG